MDAQPRPDPRLEPRVEQRAIERQEIAHVSAWGSGQGGSPPKPGPDDKPQVKLEVEYAEKLQRLRKFNSDARVVACLQSLGSMGFYDMEKNMKLCMQFHCNLDQILENLL
jgi:hypothetical protein